MLSGERRLLQRSSLVGSWFHYAQEGKGEERNSNKRIASEAHAHKVCPGKTSDVGSKVHISAFIQRSRSFSGEEELHANGFERVAVSSASFLTEHTVRKCLDVLHAQLSLLAA